MKTTVTSGVQSKSSMGQRGKSALTTIPERVSWECIVRICPLREVGVRVCDDMATRASAELSRKLGYSLVNVVFSGMVVGTATPVLVAFPLVDSYIVYLHLCWELELGEVWRLKSGRHAEVENEILRIHR